MTQRDDHTDDRRRPARPAWATVPTMQWSRVPAEEREDDDPQRPVSPAVGEPNGGGTGGAAARGVARPPGPTPLPPPAEASASMRFVTRRPASRMDPDERHPDSGRWGDTNPPAQRGPAAGREPGPYPDQDPYAEPDAHRESGWFGRRAGDDEPPHGDERPGDGSGTARGTGRAGRASVSTAPAKPSGPRPRQPVFIGPDGIPPGLRPDLVEALTAPTPPGGLRYEPPPQYQQPRRYGPDEQPEPVSAAAASVSAPPGFDSRPMSAPPAFAAPVSAPPESAASVSAPPAFAPPVSGVPVSAAPVSSAPFSAAPVSGAPVSGVPGLDGIPTSAPPTSGPPGSAANDPEQILSGWEWVFDPDTLREVAHDREGLEEIRDALTAKLNDHEDNAPRARLLSLRAVVSRILGDLQKAMADGKLALAHAEATGELRRIAIAQARLAHVLQWRGEFEEADRLFTLANSTELPDRLRATMYQHSGKCAYDQGRYIEACNHFEKALELRKAEDPEMIASTELALDAVFRKVAENGWGPYPRTREEILQLRRPPTPAMDERTGRWGFTDEKGDTKVSALYDDVQPFRDGVAWVQRPGQQTWELIDEAGQTLIPAGAGYLGVSSFSDGLAWVSRDGTARWIAIDKANTVTISTGFEDVRPFRRGMAAVRRGGRWGAVDGIGRQVVSFRYDSFATAMSDGRYIDGFSDEGLAIVELSGRKGVVDRAGRVLVEPVYPALVIHPVAFLITDGAHRWGALDRRGRMLIEPSHPSRMAVTEEIDRLLVDARPML